MNIFEESTMRPGSEKFHQQESHWRVDNSRYEHFVYQAGVKVNYAGDGMCTCSWLPRLLSALQ